MKKTFLTWLWQPLGGWREGAGYSPAIIAGVDHMLRMAVPDARHVCIADVVFHAELRALGIEPYTLWQIHDYDRLHSHGFDCYARLGLWGEPGARLAEYLGDDVAQWTDADVMIKPTAGPTLTHRWRETPEMFWIPRSHHLHGGYAFGENADTWLGVNGSAARVKLGSRPDWWTVLRDASWLAETQRHICGTDQAAITRLALEQRGHEWRAPTEKLFTLPHFGGDMQPHGMWGERWEVAYFPYDPTPHARRFTKPWLSDNGILRREYRILSGLATAEELQRERNPVLREMIEGRPHAV